MFLIYLVSDKADNYLGKFGGKTSFSHKDIATMQKLPFMPYIKLGVSRYIEYNDKIANKIDINVLYNFGMELDTDRVYDIRTVDIYRTYKYSYLSIEVAYGISFGRGYNSKMENGIAIK